MWIQTVNRGVYDYTSAKNSTPVTAHTIAYSLARTYRFRGHSRHRWTVAEHSMFVRDIGLQLIADPVEKLMAAPYLLLHDAHETFLGDIPAPLKTYLREKKNIDLKFLELEADKRIYTDLKLLAPPGWVVSLISEADIYALKMERDAFMASKHEWVIDEVKIPSHIKCDSFDHRATQPLTREFCKQIEQAIARVTSTC